MYNLSFLNTFPIFSHERASDARLSLNEQSLILDSKIFPGYFLYSSTKVMVTWLTWYHPSHTNVLVIIFTIIKNEREKIRTKKTETNPCFLLSLDPGRELTLGKLRAEVSSEWVAPAPKYWDWDHGTQGTVHWTPHWDLWGLSFFCRPSG